MALGAIIDFVHRSHLLYALAFPDGFDRLRL